jgi:hypothetical protein
MGFLKKLLFLFALLTTLMLNCGHCCEISAIKYNEGTISVPISYENDFLNSKDNEKTIYGTCCSYIDYSL